LTHARRRSDHPERGPSGVSSHGCESKSVWVAVGRGPGVILPRVCGTRTGQAVDKEPLAEDRGLMGEWLRSTGVFKGVSSELGSRQSGGRGASEPVKLASRTRLDGTGETSFVIGWAKDSRTEVMISRSSIRDFTSCSCASPLAIRTRTVVVVEDRLLLFSSSLLHLLCPARTVRDCSSPSALHIPYCSPSSADARACTKLSASGVS
jgi:hypothetical protein